MSDEWQRLHMGKVYANIIQIIKYIHYMKNFQIIHYSSLITHHYLCPHKKSTPAWQYYFC